MYTKEQLEGLIEKMNKYSDPRRSLLHIIRRELKPFGPFTRPDINYMSVDGDDLLLANCYEDLGRGTRVPFMVYIHVGGTYQVASKDGIVHHIHISDDELKDIAYVAGYQLSNECRT